MGRTWPGSLTLQNLPFTIVGSNPASLRSLGDSLQFFFFFACVWSVIMRILGLSPPVSTYHIYSAGVMYKPNKTKQTEQTNFLLIVWKIMETYLKMSSQSRIKLCYILYIQESVF